LIENLVKHGFRLFNPKIPKKTLGYIIPREVFSKFGRTHEKRLGWEKRNHKTMKWSYDPKETS